MDQAVLIAQVSDTHIVEPGAVACGRVDTAALLAAAVAHLNELRPAPDVVLVTGDLVNDGRRTQYEHLHHLLAPLQAPVVLVAGNHDDGEALRAVFPDQAPRAVREVGAVQLVVLDSLVPGDAGGRVGSEQLAWLDRVLAGAGRRPVVVAVHHPPFITGIEHMDGMGLADADELGQVIERHPHVERVLCGHLHRPIQARWRGTLAMTAPSVAHQVTLDLRAGGSATFVFEPPAVLLHRWKAGEGMTSHQSYVGRFDGPYRFDGTPA